MNEKRLAWRRHSTIESFDSSVSAYQYSTTTNSADTSPCQTPPLSRLLSYPYFDLFKQGDKDSLGYGRPRSCTVGEFAFLGKFSKTKPGKTNNRRYSSLRLSIDAPSFPSVGSVKKNRRLSVRQTIFNRIAVSPRLFLNRHSVASVNTLFEDTESSYSSRSSLTSSTTNDDMVKTAAFYRAMWKKAIVVQIETLRDKSKKTEKTTTSSNEFLNSLDLKLNYEEITGCIDNEIRTIWNAMLNHPNRESTRFDRVQIEDAVKMGIPKDMRRDVWLLLSEQHKLDKHMKLRLKDVPVFRYKQLTKELTTYQHSILIDLGRTFPAHPYFAHPLGQGQMSLFSILKAYSLYDSEVGYCQGLSFVAGLLLLHMEEEQAFAGLVELLYRFDLRKHYKPDMLALQIEMYQMSRLLSEKHKDLHDHLEEHEIPTLYAAPWFLTLFASSFPLGFVARVFDFVFLSGGLDVVFKIALVLLGDHKELIKQCNSFESINDFLKLTLPSMSYIQMERIFKQVADMDISRELLGYEVEYQVLQEEMFPYTDSTVSRNVAVEQENFGKLESVNKNLKRQNMELLEKLHQAHVKINQSESEQKDLEFKLDSSLTTINSYKCKLTNLERCIETLELERKSLLTAVQRIKSRMPMQADSEMFMSCDIPSTVNNKLVRFYSNDHSIQSPDQIQTRDSVSKVTDIKK